MNLLRGILQLISPDIPTVIIYETPPKTYSSYFSCCLQIAPLIPPRILVGIFPGSPLEMPSGIIPEIYSGIPPRIAPKILPGNLREITS